MELAAFSNRLTKENLELLTSSEVKTTWILNGMLTLVRENPTLMEEAMELSISMEKQYRKESLDSRRKKKTMVEIHGKMYSLKELENLIPVPPV